VLILILCEHTVRVYGAIVQNRQKIISSVVKTEKCKPTVFTTVFLELHNFDAAPAPGKNFDVAPALNIKPTFLKTKS
jgi:hypothetical protein